MNDQDLSYLLDYTKKIKQNRYKYVTFGANSSHINYLNQAKINYTSERLSNSKINFVIKDMKNKDLFNFVYPFYPNNSPISLKITGDKSLSEAHFSRCGFKTPTSKTYHSGDIDKALDETFKLDTNRKVVVKPKSSSLGRGVYINVSKENFKDAWTSSISELSKSERQNINNIEYIVQDILDGFEARATVMQGSLLSVTVRIPPYVVGNGTSSIKQLIDRKNKLREKCRMQKQYPIVITKKIEAFLSSNNRFITDVPSDNEPVLLSSVSNISAGGELFDITDLVTTNIKDFALDIVASVPGMYSGGLDIIMKSFDDPNPSILEANVYPNLTIPKYPTYGSQTHVSKIIIDSLIAQNQVNLPSESRYEIENEGKYIHDFISFTKRKEKFSTFNYSEPPIKQ